MLAAGKYNVKIASLATPPATTTPPSPAEAGHNMILVPLNTSDLKVEITGSKELNFDLKPD
jgi:hypothetical protein